MKSSAWAALVGLGIGLSACQNEPEETPSIEEAIPLDEPAQEAGTQPTPEPEIDTMESGSNPPEMTAPPPGSKVQPAD